MAARKSSAELDRRRHWYLDRRISLDTMIAVIVMVARITLTAGTTAFLDGSNAVLYGMN